MKQAILSVFVFSAIKLWAQPTILQTEFLLEIGDIINANTETYTAPTEGASQTWDYTSLNVAAPNVMNVIDPTLSTIVGLPTTSLCTNISGSENCYLIDGSGMQITGLGGFGINFPYSDGEYLFHFPITFGANFNDTYFSNFNNGSPGTRRGIVTSDVTGYGTLQLPNSVNINNVMQVRVHEVHTDSIDMSGTWFVLAMDVITYYFYATNYHGCILNMYSASSTINGGSPSSSSGGWYYELLHGASAETLDLSGNIELYPNPAKDNVAISQKGNIDILGSSYSITNQSGQEVKTGIINQSSMNLDISELNAGLYILLINGEHTSVYKRFIKN